ncbi:MAG: hypothetical protein SPL40_08535 [Erysipelotrichaceae bacterium]|nr:hypothetical protein [Erysipelotrichaceae bacterium]
MRLIDADALIEKSIKDANCYMDNNDIKHGYHNVQCLIYDAPTIDAVPATIEGALGYLHKVGWIQEHDRIMTEDVAPVRHGQWEVVDAEEPRRYGCSACKRLSWHMDNYCPNCGARMDGERKNDDKSCDTCKHYDKGWDDIICDGCTKAHSNWERKDDE